MKKLILSGAAAATLVAGGFWWGRATSSPGTPEDSKSGPVTHAVTGRESAEKSAAGKTAAAQLVRTFAPGRPFVKGQAKAWLLALAGTLENARDNPVALVDAVQTFLTMDEESVQEVSAALAEYTALYKAKDPTVRAALRRGDDLLEGGLMISLVRLSQLNPEAALAVIKDNPGDIDRDAVAFVVARMASQDPARAEQLAMTLPEREQRKALESMMHTMAAKDPAAAMAFAERHPKEIDAGEQRQVLENWARRDPLQAMPAAVKAMEKSGDPQLLRQPLDEWYKMDPNAAAAWVAKHDGPGKVTAQAFMLESRAEGNPEAVLPEFAALQKAAANPKELTNLAGTLASSYAKKSPAAAGQWAMTLPQGEVQSTGIFNVAQAWMRQDSVGASGWIKTLPAGDGRDRAAVELCHTIERGDPAAAFAWASSIQNAEMQGDALTRAHSLWAERDENAAKAALEALPEAARKRVRLPE